MTSLSLNSGAINAVRFPTAEQGASVIELSGTIEVTASISTLTAQIGVRPTLAVAAAKPVGCKTSVRITASTVSSASAITATPLVNVKIEGVGQALCTATGTGVVCFKRQISAVSEGSATASAVAYVNGVTGATTTASAASEVSTISLVPRAGSAVARAIASDVIALNGVSLVAQGLAGASGTANPLRQLRLGASAACLSVAAVGSKLVSQRSAQAVCAAAPNAVVAKLLLAPAASTSPSVVASASSLRRIMCPATAQPGAFSRPMVAGIKRANSAYGQPMALTIPVVFGIKRPSSAYAQPTASTGTALAGIKGPSFAYGQTQANAQASALIKCPIPASGQAMAVVQVSALAKYALAAYGQAKAIAQVSALDLSSNISAPTDRQIEVPFYDRTMKVVA